MNPTSTPPPMNRSFPPPEEGRDRAGSSGWLLPLFAPLARLALRLYYRFQVTGGQVPRRGPVLLVANHPNSLLDPAAVCAVAGRPVRFLAKATLFSEPLVGRLVRACGAIPVHRRQDDPALMDRNEEAFQAAYEALAAGGAVGIFPEGTSHNEPALVPLRTGAARIALGAARLLGGAFPIIPVGLVLRRKDRFRSGALVMVGEPAPWTDLAARGSEDGDAVRELTDRIEAALRRVTVNLERWEDAPAVECAEAIYVAEFALPRQPEERLLRLRQVADGLQELRRREPERLEPLYRSVARYAALMDRLCLHPEELRSREPGPGAVVRWALWRTLFFGLGAPLAAAGVLTFFVPYRLTGLLARWNSVEKDVRSTVQLLGGAVVYALWILALAALAGWVLGAAAGAAVLLCLPLLGVVTLLVLERWEEALADARSFFLLRGRDDLRARLLSRRQELAGRLEVLRRSVLEGDEIPLAAAPSAPPAREPRATGRAPGATAPEPRAAAPPE